MNNSCDERSIGLPESLRNESLIPIHGVVRQMPKGDANHGMLNSARFPTIILPERVIKSYPGTVEVNVGTLLNVQVVYDTQHGTHRAVHIEKARPPAC